MNKRTAIEVRMHRKFTKLAAPGIMSLLLYASFAFARQPSAPVITIEKRRISDVISLWIKAYQERDAKRLAALEMPDVETVDRFGVSRLPAGRDENEEFWSDAFDTIALNNARPAATIDHIQFLRPDVALVQVSWRFGQGILLKDGFRIPPFFQFDTFVVVKSRGAWFVAAHNMQEKKQ